MEGLLLINMVKDTISMKFDGDGLERFNVMSCKWVMILTCI
jgi:hypothetical protein